MSETETLTESRAAVLARDLRYLAVESANYAVRIIGGDAARELGRLDRLVGELDRDRDAATINARIRGEERDAARAEAESLAVSSEAAEVVMAALGETLGRAIRERDAARAEDIKAGNAIRAIFLNGADQENWPPGTHYADALRPYVERLLDENAALRERAGRAEVAIRHAIASIDHGSIGLARAHLGVGLDAAPAGGSEVRP